MTSDRDALRRAEAEATPVGLRESIARVLCKVEHYGGDVWDEVREDEQDEYLGIAHAVLAVVAPELEQAEAKRDEWREVAQTFCDDYHAELTKRLDAEARAAAAEETLGKVAALADEWEAWAKDMQTKAMIRGLRTTLGVPTHGQEDGS